MGTALLVGVQGFVVAVLVRVVQGSFLGVLLGMSSEPVGRVAVVSGLFVVALLEVLNDKLRRDFWTNLLTKATLVELRANLAPQRLAEQVAQNEVGFEEPPVLLQDVSQGMP